MKTWGIGATLGFAFIAFLFGQAVGVGAVTAAMGADVVRAGYDGAAVAVSVLVGNPIQVVTLALAVRMTGEDVFTYLALDVPRRADVTVAVAGLAVLIVAANLLTLAMGRELVPPFQLEVHRSALAEGALLSLWIAVVVVAPAGEELLFRGFMFRGFVHGSRDDEIARARRIVAVFGQPEHQARNTAQSGPAQSGPAQSGPAQSGLAQSGLAQPGLARSGAVQAGVAERPRDALPGILAISLIWAFLHVQYDWFSTALVFAIGVYLGFIRFYSGSTTLVILLHMLLNLESVAETVIVLGWV
jgi:membrane protease YdiL (CAAX protease family)